MGRLHYELNFITAEEIVNRGLHEFLTDVLDRFDSIGLAIAETYLRY